jgi:hypothetical protein
VVVLAPAVLVLLPIPTMDLRERDALYSHVIENTAHPISSR